MTWKQAWDVASALMVIALMMMVVAGAGFCMNYCAAWIYGFR